MMLPEVQRSGAANVITCDSAVFYTAEPRDGAKHGQTAFEARWSHRGTSSFHYLVVDVY
jgi:sulfur transfer protein SufE